MIPYSYTNWMGYEIHVGDLVFYSTGGSYPDFRVGQVIEFKEFKGHTYGRKPEILAKVNWLWERGYQHEDKDKNFHIPFAVSKTSTVNAEVICPVGDNLADIIGHHKAGLDRVKTTVV